VARVLAGGAASTPASALISFERLTFIGPAAIVSFCQARFDVCAAYVLIGSAHVADLTQCASLPGALSLMSLADAAVRLAERLLHVPSSCKLLTPAGAVAQAEIIVRRFRLAPQRVMRGWQRMFDGYHGAVPEKAQHGDQRVVRLHHRGEAHAAAGGRRAGADDGARATAGGGDGGGGGGGGWRWIVAAQGGVVFKRRGDRRRPRGRDVVQRAVDALAVDALAAVALARVAGQGADAHDVAAARVVDRRPAQRQQRRRAARARARCAARSRATTARRTRTRGPTRLSCASAASSPTPSTAVCRARARPASTASATSWRASTTRSAGTWRRARRRSWQPCADAACST
jgi:hypothetical protein